MKVSKNWLKELVELKVSMEEVQRLLPLRTIATKEITDRFIELDMKGYNRADLLSMRGVAYEVAAITDSKVKFKEPDENEYIWVGQNLPELPVEVKNSDLCPIYCLVKIEGLKAAESNADWKRKIEDSGMRVVNNIADVTNLVMLEYGQPLHVFDATSVEDEKIIVRRADKSERIETLDGKTRELEISDLLITDSNKALGIAGVMGGKNSEVTDRTSTILLEAAIFNPANLRRTSTRLGLQSEASKRFYHGLTKIRLFQALDAAIRLYQGLGGRVTGFTIKGDIQEVDKDVVLIHKKVSNLIGLPISKEFIEESLTQLNFRVNQIVPFTEPEEIAWKVMPPYWRRDIEISEDLIEEVARMYGYERIPAKKLGGVAPDTIDQSLFEIIAKLKNSLVKNGLIEMVTYSFLSTDVVKKLEYDTEELIKIANPISSETEYMRVVVWPSLLEKTVENLKYFEDVAVFEVGKSYHKNGLGALERRVLSLALSNGSENPIQELYGILKRSLEEIGIRIEHKKGEENVFSEKYFHPTRFVNITVGGKEVGYLAEVHPRIVNRFGNEKRIAIAEIELEKLI